VQTAQWSDDWVGIMKRLDDQCWYTTSQRKNKKTKAVLSQWFSEEWADKYINNILFDKP
jgi:phycocyanobilin:ferredoxin oxidoreductase